MSRNPLFIASSFILLLSACPGASEDSDSSTDASSTGPGIDIDKTDTSTGEPDPTSTSAPPTSDGSDGSGSTTEPFICFKEEITAEVKIPRVMLVLDKSRSMVAPGSGFWDADGDDADDDGFIDGDPDMKPATPRVTRWNSLYSVVDFIVTGFESRMDFGAVLFPSTAAKSAYDASSCPVNAEPEVPVGVDMGATILATIPGPDELGLNGGTPAAAGITTAIGGLPRNEELTLDQDLRYIVLVTDGAANCAIDAATNKERFEVYDEHLPEMVAGAKQAGIPTFVVGIDIKNESTKVIDDGNPDATNTYDKLNELAEIGGQAREGSEKFYNTVNQIELQAALEAISQEITSCTLELSAPLTEYQFVQQVMVDTDKDPATPPLTYDNSEVTDCATESGWHFTDETRQFIELCGAACDAYKASGDVDITFDCNAP